MTPDAPTEPEETSYEEDLVFRLKDASIALSDCDVREFAAAALVGTDVIGAMAVTAEAALDALIGVFEPKWLAHHKHVADCAHCATGEDVTRQDQLQTFEERLTSIEEAVPGYRKLWEQLEAKLAGGLVVAPPEPIEWLGELLTEPGEGRFFEAQAVAVQGGAPNECFQNSVLLASSLGRPGPWHLCVGFGLTDGLWRAHWWVWSPAAATILETTVVRDRYWGAAVDTLEDGEP